MHMGEKLIWRSDTGQRAWQCPDSGLPRGYRRILDVLATPLAESKVIHALREFEPKQIRRWMDELETLCFIHASRIDESNDYLNEKAA